jgi:RsiW-degrading membrane proteinase PrsW (M82 family)
MLSPSQIYSVFTIAGAVCGAMLWLGYFKRIDALERERTIDICIAFITGFFTPDIALWFSKGLKARGMDFNGEFFNDFFFSILGVGVTEEISKLAGVAIVFILLKKRINEPLDYLVFGGVVALGFSVRENFIYYYNYGAQLITGRTFISCLVHIINTSIAVYGMYRARIFNKGNVFLNAFTGISVAIVSHGLFDFFLTQPVIGPLTPFLSSIVYLIGINFWIQMINNCINFSPFFDYRKIVSVTKLYQTILLWYAIAVVVEFSYSWYFKTLSQAFTDSLKNVFNEGFLLLIVALRAGRISINKRKYVPIKIQLPFLYTKNDDEDFIFLGLPIKIRGENEKEIQFLHYVGRDILLCPVKPESSVLQGNLKAHIIKKYFLKNDVITYLVKVETLNNNEAIYLLKPKTTHVTLFENTYPIAKLMLYSNVDIEKHKATYKDLEFLEEVYLKELG